MIDFWLSLQRNHEITKVAMPRICCGNDGLDWKQVKRIMQQIFSQSEYPIEILVCQHEDISAEVREIQSVMPAKLADNC